MKPWMKLRGFWVLEFLGFEEMREKMVRRGNIYGWVVKKKKKSSKDIDLDI